MKMRVLTVAVLAALASGAALAAGENGQPVGSAGVASALTGRGDYWQPPFGGRPIPYPGVASTLGGSTIDWQPPFGGHATRSVDVAVASGSTIDWRPPFGGHATRSADAGATMTGSNDVGQPR